LEKLLRVLFVEDSEDDTFLIISHIRNAGYTITYTRVENDVEFKKALLLKDNWDIILSDYSLPGFSGRRALDLFRISGLEIPFILISGAVGEDLAVLMLKLGSSDFILKSNLRRLVPAIERSMEISRLRREQLALAADTSSAESVMMRSPVAVYQGSFELDIPPDFISGNFCRFGFSLVDFEQKHKSFKDIIHPDDLEKVWSEIQKHDKEKNDSYTLCYRIINDNKDNIQVYDLTNIRRNEAGEITQREGSIIAVSKL
jgi:CheY-like chemotaxis protein